MTAPLIALNLMACQPTGRITVEELSLHLSKEMLTFTSSHEALGVLESLTELSLANRCDASVAQAGSAYPIFSITDEGVESVVSGELVELDNAAYALWLRS